MPILGSSASGAKSSPVAPTIGTATNVGTSRAYNNGSATVTFTAPTSKLPITQYTVTSSPGSFTGTGASSPITVAGLQSATAYTFTVTATSAAGTSAASSASNSITATTVPQAPTIGTATSSGPSAATVAYTAGATGGAAVSTFTATSSPSSLTGTGASPITVSGLSSGTAYTFTVTATNANGTSTASAVSNSITPQLARFVAFGAGTDKPILYSDNGSSWTTSAYTTSNVAGASGVYGANKYVIPGSSLYYYSSDGATWSTIAAPLDNISSMMYNGTAFVGVKYDSASAYVTRSTNGTTWTNIQIDATAGYFTQFKVVFAGSTFYTMNNNVYSQSHVSTDNGSTWSRSSPLQGFQNSVTLPNGTTVAGYQGKFRYTTNMTSSTTAPASWPNNFQPTQIAGDGNNYIATRYDNVEGYLVSGYYTTTGLGGTWASTGSTFGYGNQMYKTAAYNNAGTWVFGNEGSSVSYSTNGTSMTAVNIGGAALNNGTYVMFSTNNG